MTVRGVLIIVLWVLLGSVASLIFVSDWPHHTLAAICYIIGGATGWTMHVLANAKSHLEEK